MEVCRATGQEAIEDKTYCRTPGTNDADVAAGTTLPSQGGDCELAGAARTTIARQVQNAFALWHMVQEFTAKEACCRDPSATQVSLLAPSVEEAVVDEM